MKILIKTSIYTLVLFLSAINLVSAIQAEDISVKLNPENPKPFSDVTITIESFSFNINNASVDWKSNGKVVASGQGKTSYIFKTGGANTTTNFEISILPEDSSVPVRKSVSITPSDIDILWEATDSYTPPFYKGKALPSKQSRIKVIAIPNTSGLTQVNQKNINYVWKSDFNTVKNASGVGKNEYIFINSEIKNTEKIGVDISNSVYKSNGSINIDIISPEILFYKKNPLEGVLYQNNIKDGDFITDDELTVKVEPFFMSSIENKNYFKYEWRINDNKIDNPENPRELTVRPSSRGGYADINFSIENINKLFQKVSKNLRLEL